MQMRPSFFFEPKVELQQQPSDNPAEENGDPEPRSGEEQELVEQSDGREGPKTFFKKVVAHRTDFCVY